MRGAALALVLFVVARVATGYEEEIAENWEEDPYACVRDPTFEDDPVEEAAPVMARAMCLSRCLAENKENISCEAATCSEEELKRRTGSKPESSFPTASEAERASDSWVTRPRLHCRTLDSIVVTWSASGVAAAPDSVFVVTARPDPRETDGPRQHIITRDTKLTLNTSATGETYQIRLQVMRKDGWFGQACDSEWISTFNVSQSPLPVRNLNVTGVIGFTKKNVTLGIEWEPAQDKVCSYRIFYWNPSDTMTPLRTYVHEKVFSANLKDLAFNSVYELYITSEVHFGRRSLESEKVGINVTTPSCLELYNNNIDICSPPPPKMLNITFLMTDVDQYKMNCSWTPGEVIPRSYTAYITQIDFEANWSKNKTVLGNVTEVIFPKIKPDTTYRVCVRAESQGGNSSRTCVFRIFRKYKMEDRANKAVMTIIIVLTLLVIMCIVMFVLYYKRSIKHKIRQRRFKYFEGLDKEPPQQNDLSLTYFDEWEIPMERLVLRNMLGGGAFGIVREGLLRGQTPSQPDMKVAVKMLRGEPSRESLRQFKREIDMMKGIGNHPHIVSIIGYCTTSRQAQLIVEHCALGDLLHYLHNTEYEHMPVIKRDQSEKIKYADLLTQEDNSEGIDANRSEKSAVTNRMYFYEKEEPKCKDIFTVVDRLSFSRQIAMGMEFLAGNRIVHRDLAARNVLVCADKTIKISDFGLSRDIYEQNIYYRKGNDKLPVKWTALEALLYHIYTTFSDVWSFGILLWEIVTMGCEPYVGTPPERIIKLLKTGYRLECPPSCSEELYEIMLSCWKERPKKRPTFTELNQKLDGLLERVSSQEYLNLNGSNPVSPATSVSVMEHHSSIPSTSNPNVQRSNYSGQGT